MSIGSRRVAIVADGIWVYGGAERVLECMLQIYPDADIYSLVDTLDAPRQWLGGRTLTTSFLQKMPGAKHYFRKLLSLWPIAIEQFDLTSYDLVISSQFAVSHGVITGPYQTHVVYTHSPMRYIWDLRTQYLQEAQLDRGLKTVIARHMLHNLRLWDTIAASRVDRFSANSAFVAERIRKYYRRDSIVIHPPVFLDRFTYRVDKDDYYLYLGRLVAYKGVELIVDAFNSMSDKKLVVAGEGPLFKRLKARAMPNVHVVGEVDETRANSLMGAARAYICAAIEDFGIAAVEAQAAGTPVVGLGIGGLLETVSGLDETRPTGLFFMEQTKEAICNAIGTFQRIGSGISPLDCATNALRFAPEIFRKKFQAFVGE